MWGRATNMWPRPSGSATARWESTFLQAPARCWPLPTAAPTPGFWPPTCWPNRSTTPWPRALWSPPAALWGRRCWGRFRSSWPAWRRRTSPGPPGRPMERSFWRTAWTRRWTSPTTAPPSTWRSLWRTRASCPGWLTSARCSSARRRARSLGTTPPEPITPCPPSGRPGTPAACGWAPS